MCRDWSIRGINRGVGLMAKIEPLAVGAEWGIRCEALSRSVIGAPLRSGTGPLGLRTLGAHWSVGPHVDADQLPSRRPTNRLPASRKRKPVVYWHESGSGPPLLLLNGWTASGLVWPEWWLARLQTQFRVIRVDNRGTGFSRTAPAPFTIGDMADDARDVLRASGVDRAVVLGYSMGGLIAQELALRHPRTVGRLILVATTPPHPASITPDYSRLLENHPLRELLRPPGPLMSGLSALLTQSAANGFTEARPDLIEELLAQLRRHATPKLMALAQARAIQAWHGPQRLAELSTPTTVVHGDHDPFAPLANGLRLCGLIAGAKYEELRGVGHLVPAEAGDELLRIVGSHLT